MRGCADQHKNVEPKDWHMCGGFLGVLASWKVDIDYQCKKKLIMAVVDSYWVRIYYCCDMSQKVGKQWTKGC